MAQYSRYVAIGDSQTEGLWDGDDSNGLTGFADRLAMIIDAHHPGVEYANLAVRGRRILDLLVEQLPLALAMQPDLITVCIGMNDVTRPGPFFDRALADLDTLHSRLAESGATVVTTTFPDLAQILPVGRRHRGTRREDQRRDQSCRGPPWVRLVDLYDAPSMLDPEIWSPDRVHGSTKGHILFAAAAAEALGLPGSSRDWAQADGAWRPSLRSRAHSQVLWTQNMLMPWLWRHVRGKSEGDGRRPKRPRLQSVAA